MPFLLEKDLKFPKDNFKSMKYMPCEMNPSFSMKRVRQWYEHWEENDMKEVIRDTNTVLMNQVLELVKKNECYDKAGPIMDYFLAEDYKVQQLSDYRFDFLTRLNFGASEGIYLDCYIEGIFTEKNADNKVERLSCGTFKTLEDDLEAMKTMGELAGSLIYFASKYVNQEIDRYTPLKELEVYRREL